MNKICNYMIVQTKDVQGYVSSGWQPFGSPFTVGTVNVIVYQAIVRYGSHE